MDRNTHSLDVARFIHKFAKSARRGEVYSLGGRANSCSILEAFRLVESFTRSSRSSGAYSGDRER